MLFRSMVATQPPVQVQKWGHGAGKTNREGIETTKDPKAPVTPFGTLLQKVMHAPVLPQT